MFLSSPVRPFDTFDRPPSTGLPRPLRLLVLERYAPIPRVSCSRCKRVPAIAGLSSTVGLIQEFRERWNACARTSTQRREKAHQEGRKKEKTMESRCARTKKKKKKSNRRVTLRRVELIIGRSVRIAGPPLVLHPRCGRVDEGKERDKKKGIRQQKEGRQYGLKGGRSSLRVEH